MNRKEVATTPSDGNVARKVCIRTDTNGLLVPAERELDKSIPLDPSQALGEGHPPPPSCKVASPRVREHTASVTASDK